MPNISNNKIRQKEDDQHARESGSMQGFPITPVSEDSPRIISEVSQGNAVQKPIEPINDGTRDGYYDETTDKDKNLHQKFVKPNEIG
ncbi:MAG TPA: hypothetical protein ENH85_11625 [Candidatus Scalindua sp.]|nr:hypothetical protein [Candidatus Scalindua sp.]